MPIVFCVVVIIDVVFIVIVFSVIVRLCCRICRIVVALCFSVVCCGVWSVLVVIVTGSVLQVVTGFVFQVSLVVIVRLCCHICCVIVALCHVVGIWSALVVVASVVCDDIVSPSCERSSSSTFGVVSGIQSWVPK